MAETLGSLTDKLSIVNLKLWFVQEKVHQAAKNGSGVDPESTRSLVSLNLQRNRLMTEMDQLLADAVRTGVANVDPRIKLT